MSGLLLSADRLVDGAGREGPGFLRVVAGRVAEVGSGHPPGRPDVTLGTVVPGFLDTHVHGAMGTSFAAVGTDPSPAIEHHARTGSTRVVASLATGRIPALIARMSELVPLVRDGTLAGIHLEGPFLSPARRGAHNPDLLRTPDAATLDALLAAGEGGLRMITIAPELPGGLEAIRRIADAGVVVAVGHSDGSADVVLRAVDAGATVVTHLFNGMPPLHHRSPGPVGVALTDDRLTVELIGDGVHVDDRAIDLVRRAAPGRWTLVSDAVAAAGLGDGRHELAGSQVVVSGGAVTVEGTSALAGSTMPLAGAARRLVARGAPLAELVAATSTVPARSLGLASGRLVPGEAADLVELDGASVRRVMRGGVWLAPL
jgi:N-acetylglucosamine-6-phosphate deacetylase